jgi:hypothetical protein
MVKAHLNTSSSGDVALVEARSEQQDLPLVGCPATKGNTADRKPGKSGKQSGEQRGGIDAKKATRGKERRPGRPAHKPGPRRWDKATSSSESVDQSKQSREKKAKGSGTRQSRAQDLIVVSEAKTRDETNGNADAVKDLAFDALPQPSAPPADLMDVPIDETYEFGKKFFAELTDEEPDPPKDASPPVGGLNFLGKVWTRWFGKDIKTKFVVSAVETVVGLSVNAFLLPGLIKLLVHSPMFQIPKIMKAFGLTEKQFPVILMLRACGFIQNYISWFRRVAFAIYLARFLKTLTQLKYKETLSVVGSDVPLVSDVRPDLVALSDLKHRDNKTLQCVFRHHYVLPSPIYGEVNFLRRAPEVKMKVSAELLAQMLSQPVCSLNSDEETTWLRINQSLRSLHTVNEDRYENLNEMLVRQETAVAANFIFNVEKDKLENVPFPRPHRT